MSNRRHFIFSKYLDLCLNSLYCTAQLKDLFRLVESLTDLQLRSKSGLYGFYSNIIVRKVKLSIIAKVFGKESPMSELVTVRRNAEVTVHSLLQERSQ